MRPSWLNVPPSMPINWLKPMPTRYGRPSAYRRLLTKLQKRQLNGRVLLLVTLLLIVALSGCCQVPQTVPSVAPTIPTQPVLQQPLPKETYSSSVQQDLSKWQQRLTDMLQTQ